MKVFTIVEWSPYVVGALIGVLNIVSLLLSDKVIGTSTSYARASGMIRKLFDREYVENNEFYLKTAPEVDWAFMLVIGIVIGSFISAMLSGDFGIVAVPPMWASEISGGFFLRLIVAVFGGVIIAIGSRWAGGCTSGHGISGTGQLSVLSWIAAIFFFIGGIATALLIYGL